MKKFKFLYLNDKGIKTSQDVEANTVEEAIISLKKYSIENKNIISIVSWDNQKKLICPRCHKEYSGYSSISRDDNKTEICPDCGIQEALIIFMKNTKKRGV